MDRKVWQWDADIGKLVEVDLNPISIEDYKNTIRDLVEALEHFTDKVDRGEARSVESYAEMKEALTKHAEQIKSARGE